MMQERINLVALWALRCFGLVIAFCLHCYSGFMISAHYAGVYGHYNLMTASPVPDGEMLSLFQVTAFWAVLFSAITAGLYVYIEADLFLEKRFSCFDFLFGLLIFGIVASSFVLPTLQLYQGKFHMM